MSTETMLREHLQAAAGGVGLESKPVDEFTGRVRRTRLMFGLATAAVLVVIVGVVGLVRGGSNELISPPPVADGSYNSSILALLPDSFDPASAMSLFGGEGDVAEVAQAYLSASVGVETAIVAVEEPSPGLFAVRWGWGRLAGVTSSQDEGNLGWILLRGDADGRLGVIASTTDGVDLSELSLVDGRLSVVVNSAPFAAVSLDVLDTNDVPVDGVLHPDGVFPAGAVRYGTAGVADRDVPGGVTSLEFRTEGIHFPVVVRAHLVGGTLLTVSEVVLVPATPSPPTTAAPTTTSTAPTTTTAAQVDPVAAPPAWSVAEAERDVQNLLAALAAGAYEQAAWPTENNGGVYDGQGGNESNAEFLARVCDAGACLGPYEVTASGPGLVDPTSSQASSTVTVTHIPSGATGEMTVATFEGQRMVLGLPPLVPSAGGPSLVAQLFGGDLPARVVVERFDAFEIWENGGSQWVTNWWADEAIQVEHDIVMTDAGLAVGLRDPSVSYQADCGSLMTRLDQVLLLESCWSDGWAYSYLTSGETVGTPVEPNSGEDGQWSWFTERNGVTLTGEGDAEGNLASLESDRGVDLIGDDYVGYLALSVDGTRVAYVDHRNDSAYSHFWSPVVVVKDVASGNELGQWVLDGPVLCLEFSGDWVVACEGRADLSDVASGMPAQAALTAINVGTGQVNRVETHIRVFLPS